MQQLLKLCEAWLNPSTVTGIICMSVIEIALIALALSIGALAVGLSLAMLNVSVWLPSVVIGFVAGGMSLVGIHLGSRLQVRLGRKAEILGGIILIIIAIRIVVEHTLLS